MSTTRSVLFGERAAGVYLLTEIYDPDVDGDSVSASGKIVPAVGSLVVDNTTGLHNQQYTVTAVDQTTYKATMIPSTFVVDATAQVDRVLSYGNDIFMLYFSDAQLTVKGSNINLTRLIVDNKLCLFGNHAATYQLVKTDEDGNETIISRWYKSGDATLRVINGTIESSQITGMHTAVPMLDTGVEGIRKCDGCYTEIEMTEGDEIRCDVYTAGGLLISQINLIAKKAHLLNQTINTTNPITAMMIQANQMDLDGNLYLYLGQNVSELAIFVCLQYSDGHIARIAIDNTRGFIYGLESITTNYLNDDGFPILAKYYLSDSDACPQYWKTTDAAIDPQKTYYIMTESGDFEAVTDPVAEDLDQYYEKVENDKRVRFITATTKVKIVSSEKDLISKISAIPVKNDKGVWELKFLRYRTSRLVAPSSNEAVTIGTKNVTCTLNTVTTASTSWNVDATAVLVYTRVVEANIVSGTEVFSDSGCTIHLGYVKTTDLANHKFTMDLSTFVGNWYNVAQTVSISTKQIVNGIENTITKSFVIEVRQSDSAGVNWLISDNEGDIPYGCDDRPHIRPVIKYKASKGGYYIPDDLFCASTNQSAVEVFLENFYVRAQPPKLTGESLAPTPTHFIVKTSDGKSLMQTTYSVNNFSDVLNLETYGGQDNCYIGATLVVEFYRNFKFEKTEDTVFQADKVYYVLDSSLQQLYKEAEVTVGEAIPEDVDYFEKVILPCEEILYGVPVDVTQG